jgi:hypothetical protein
MTSTVQAKQMPVVSRRAATFGVDAILTHAR